MYSEHFDLNERPFTHAPGHRFYAANAGVTEALGRLQHVLTARDAIALVTGGPGVGKSALAECALAALPDRVAVVRVDLRYGNPDDLFAAIVLALNEDAGELTPVQAMRALRETMSRLVREDRRLILSLDIGNITTDLAKNVLRIANLAGERDCQMNILLMGPHPLHQQLDVPALIQLRQRIAFRYRVRPLTLVETERYIRHQIEATGGDATTLMSSNVAAAVYCYVAGVPRLINTLLDATLSDAALQKLKKPDGGLVKRTADGLGWKPMTPPQTAADPAQRPASEAARPTASRSFPPKVIIESAAALSERGRASVTNGGTTEPERSDAPPASEMTLQLRTNDSGAPGTTDRPSSVPLASDGKSPTAAIFGSFGSATPPPTSRPTSMPEMDADDTSATGMLRLQDLDDRFAETIFGKDAEDLVKRQANN